MGRCGGGHHRSGCGHYSPSYNAGGYRGGGSYRGGGVYRPSYIPRVRPAPVYEQATMDALQANLAKKQARDRIMLTPWEQMEASATSYNESRLANGALHQTIGVDGGRRSRDVMPDGTVEKEHTVLYGYDQNGNIDTRGNMTINH